MNGSAGLAVAIGLAILGLVLAATPGSAAVAALGLALVFLAAGWIAYHHLTS